MTKQIAISKLNSFLLLIGAMLFFAMLFAPFEVVLLKVVLIVILLISVVCKTAILKEVAISYEILVWLLIFILHGIFFTVYGFLNPHNNKEFVIRSASVNILWPILYSLLIMLLSQLDTIKFLIKISLLALIAIGIYLLLSGLSFVGLIPIPFDLFGMAKPVIGKYETTVQLFLPATTSLLFLVPFFISCLLLNMNKLIGLRNYQLIVAITLGFVGTIITARRALILNILISPVLLYMLLKAGHIRLSYKVKKRIILTFIVFVLVAALALFLMVQYEIFDIKALTELFLQGFNLSSGGSDEGSSIRGKQFSLLLDSWKDHPLLGSGHGSSSQYIVRSDETPWIYELSYVALLFQTGLIGILIYLGLLAWVVIKGILLVRQDGRNAYLIPALVGYMCFLIGNTSNPYLAAYDYMWAIFFPLGIINQILLSKNRYNIT